LGPFSCAFRASYAAQFAAICVLPVVSALGVALVYSLAALWRAARAPRGTGIGGSSGGGSSRCCGVLGTASLDIRDWFAKRRYLPPLLTVASLAYMPVVSACARALDCTEAVEGVRYLRADLRMRCDATSGYPGLAAAAVAVLVLFGAGCVLCACVCACVLNAAHALCRCRCAVRGVV
jgi:hypothetical protein